MSELLRIDKNSNFQHKGGEMSEQPQGFHDLECQGEIREIGELQKQLAAASEAEDRRLEDLAIEIVDLKQQLADERKKVKEAK